MCLGAAEAEYTISTMRYDMYNEKKKSINETNQPLSHDRHDELP